MSGFATARQKMVDGQVRPSDVTDIRIIDAMLAVPREAFVPENKQALAYLDLDLDVSEGGAAKRYLIKPAVLAKMLQAADIKASDRVLVVGCASGYARADRQSKRQRAKSLDDDVHGGFPADDGDAASDTGYYHPRRFESEVRESVARRAAKGVECGWKPPIPGAAFQGGSMSNSVFS